MFGYLIKIRRIHAEELKPETQLAGDELKKTNNIINKYLIDNTLTNDQFGIKMLYPTKSGGQEYFFNDSNPTSDRRFDWSGISVNKLNGEEGWHAKDDSPRIHILSQDAIGFSDSNFEPGPNGKMQGGFNFANLKQLGNWFKDSDWKNVEITCHVRIHKCHDDSEGFGFEVRSVRHKSNPPEPEDVNPGDVWCGGSSYHGNFNFHDEDHPIGSTRFRKEHFHNKYKSLDYSDESRAIGNVKDKWFGFKFVVYNATNGDVVLEIWLDKDCTNNWVKNNSAKDTGTTWGTFMKRCGCSTNTEKISWGSPLIRLFKNNNGLDWDIRRLSCREISPPT